MTLRIDEEAKGVVTVAIDRPQLRNALDSVTMATLTATARDLGRLTDVHAVILTGNDRFFSCGIDLKAESSGETMSLIERREALRAGPEMCRAWEEIEAITIAAIDGFCVGGALALALACDFRILGGEAMLRLPEVPLGMNMSWQALPRLAALCGPARAKRIALFGEPVTPEEAIAWGLCDAIAPPGQAVTTARDWALKIAALPPIPVRMTKEAINRNAYALADATSFADRDQFLLTALSADFAEGKEAFLAKRPPHFRGD